MAPHPPTPTPPCCRVEEACSHWCLQRESCPQPLPFLAGVPAQKWWWGGVVGSLESPTPRVVAEISRWDVCSFPQEEG